MSTSSLRNSTVTNEDCVLHLTYTGTGSTLIVLIPGGHGLGATYYAALPGLVQPRGTPGDSKSYTVATFDRRGHGASNRTSSGAVVASQLNPAQSARDVLAVIKHLGFQSATVFGNSGGGIIAFQFAIMFPQHLNKLIAHETPTMALLPGSEGVEMLDFCFDVYQKFKSVGPSAAMAKFLCMAKGWQAKGSDDSTAGSDRARSAEAEIPMDSDHLYWFEQEYIVFTVYTPNLLELKAHLQRSDQTMSCACVAGAASGDAPYAKTTYVQKDILGCQHHLWPGGHLIFQTDPKALVIAMLETMEKLER